MIKLWYKLGLIIVAAGCVLAQNNDYSHYWDVSYDETWYDDVKDVDASQKPDVSINLKQNKQSDEEIDNKVAIENQDNNESDNFDAAVNQEINEFNQENQVKPDIGENVEDLSSFNGLQETNDNDYVFEDNRSDSQENQNVDTNNGSNVNDNVEDNEPDVIQDNTNDYVFEDNRSNSQENQYNGNDNADEINVNDGDVLNVDDSGNKDDLLNIFNEIPDVIEFKTQDNISDKSDSGENILENKNDRSILSMEENSLFDLHADNSNTDTEVDKKQEIIIEETGPLLHDTNSKFDAETEEEQNVFDKPVNMLEEEDNTLLDSSVQNNNDMVQDNENVFEKTKQLLSSMDSDFEDANDENVEKDYADVDYDLDQLLKTLDMLSEDGKKIPETQLEADKPEEESNQIKDYEEKYGRPYGEANVLKLRQDYIDDLDNPDTRDENQQDNDSDDDNANKSQISSDITNINIDEILKKLDEELEIDSTNDEKKSNERFYGDDALLANKEQGNNADNKQIKSTDNLQLTANERTNTIDNLDSSEYKSKMDELVKAFKNELNVDDENFDRNVAPIYMTIHQDEIVTVSSPNYPDPHPTNNIVDWIFEGDGLGIELNITDFAVNGINGDYLLVIPGGIDESGEDGLLFSYHLNSERRYRFLDVDRMFVRFFAHPGMAFTRGFQFSVKLVGPRPQIPEPVPPPVPEIAAPEQTVTVYFEGLLANEFEERVEVFRGIVADMATLFIHRNGIDLGEVDTINVTQVTRMVDCKLNWPGHAPCTAVTFGVPLDYADNREYRLTTGDLVDMWYTYSYIDPFALRLRRMGVTEFAVPDDGATLMIWTLIAAGVLISVIMLGFAIWRFNCFQNYTRMPVYTDTDSIISNNKRDELDLYPTPHQNLPPLYSDIQFDHKWVSDTNSKYEDTSRVDLGGYTNKSYARDSELLDIDSDDDVIVSLPGQNSSRKERFHSTISSKNTYEA